MFTDKTDFLVDTLQYYTEDINRRCVPLDGKDPFSLGCYYSPQNVGKDGISEGCAIGRWMTPENQLKADEIGNKTGNSSVYDLYDEDLFPEWMRQLGVGFLDNCQSLHDRKYNWGDKSLTEEGKEKLTSMINEFNLDKDKLNRFL